VSFVAISDDVLGRPLLPAANSPLNAGRKSGPTSAPQPGACDLFDHRFRGQCCQNLLQRSIAVPRDIVLNLLRVDDGLVPEDDERLLAEEREIGDPGNLWCGRRWREGQTPGCASF